MSRAKSLKGDDAEYFDVAAPPFYNSTGNSKALIKRAISAVII